MECLVKMGRRVESHPVNENSVNICKLDFCADFEDHPKRVMEMAMVSGVFSIAKLCFLGWRSCGLYRAG